MGRPERDKGNRQRRPARGMGQLSLVEHALCPLAPQASLRPNVAFEYEYHYADANRHLRTAHARVVCPDGLAASDEFFLWGLLALTFAQPEPDGELHATPHYCLRRLGLIDQHNRRGGRQYSQFTQAVERLASISYRNDAFYDPIRAEHRRVKFGFLSYDLPLDPDSSRAWRIAWNPVFFGFVRSAGGSLRFDLDLYRELDPAARRLFLFSSKVFARRETMPKLDLRHLAVNVMGFQPTVSAWNLKIKVGRCVDDLVKRGVFAPVSGKESFEKEAPGRYSLLLQRGPYFERRSQDSETKHETDSSLHELLLRGLELDDAAAARLLRRYPARVVREWADITLAAKERFGMSFFKRSPQAYFVNNVQSAAQGTRTPPDWWRELRALERQRRRTPAPSGEPAGGLDDESRSVLERIREAVFDASSGDAPIASPLPSAAAHAKPNDPAPIGNLLKFPSIKRQ